MKKLSLNLDQLEVDSFNTAPDPATRSGTVFGRETENYGACTGNYYTCDAQCNTVQTADVEVTCDMYCYGGGTGGGGDSMHTACLACFSQAQGCTQFEGCHTTIETCFPCG